MTSTPRKRAVGAIAVEISYGDYATIRFADAATATAADLMMAHLAAHPYAAVIAMMAVLVLLNSAGVPFVPPRPVAKRFLTRDLARDAMAGHASYRKIRIPAHARSTLADVRAAVGGLNPLPPPIIERMAR